MNEIANGLLHTAHSAPLGVVPTGTGNDFARSMGLPRDVGVAVALAWEGGQRLIDVAACGERFFLSAGGVGFRARGARTPAAYLAPSE